MPSHRPIVVLDSGLGGLTVVRALRAALPAEDLLYFGDTARLPYGTKTASTITTYVRQIINHLRPYDPKHVVIACNTASALALATVRPLFPALPISGVVEPGAKAAVVAAGARQVPHIGVLATEATIRSKAYERAILRRRSHAKVLLRPAPLLVPIIEEGRTDADPLVQLAVRQYLAPLVEHRLDVLVLGCTHYPLLRRAICGVVGPRVAVIDSAEQCAEDVARRLAAAGMLRSVHPAPVRVGGGADGDAAAKVARSAAPPTGSLRCFVTDDPPRFAALASRFLGTPVAPPTWVPPDALYAANRPAAIALRKPA